MTCATPAKCIYCGDRNVALTHVWPHWLDAMFPEADLAAMAQQAEQPPEPISARAALAQPFSQRPRLTCDACNSGWINDLGEQVQHFLMPALRGGKVDLTPASVEALCGLLCLIAINTAFMTQDCGVSPGDRSLLRHLKRPPRTWSIHAAGLSGSDWSRACKHYPFRIEFAGNPMATRSREQPITARNTQHLSIAMGPLFFQVFSSPSLCLLLDFAAWCKSEGLTQLWPPVRQFGFLPRANIRIPPDKTLTDAQASGIADLFGGRLRERLGRHRPAESGLVAAG